MIVTWIGHSCFKVEKDGYTVVFDPYEAGYVPGLGDVDETANMVLCSHQHNDHNAAGEVKIVPTLVNAPAVKKINVSHDEKGGSLRGRSDIHIVDFGDEKVIHMGDIGIELTADEEEQLKGADLLLIPIGGFYTIDYKQAAEMVNKLEPKVVVPMHFRDDAAGFGYEVIDTVDNFEKAMEGKMVLKRISGFETAIAPANSVVIMIPARI